jgi:uncharacterized MnhB-related membrane protein
MKLLGRLVSRWYWIAQAVVASVVAGVCLYLVLTVPDVVVVAGILGVLAVTSLVTSLIAASKVGRVRRSRTRS